MLLARLGHDVVVLDQASFPSDTTSTHSIARSGVVQLHRWGLLDAVTGSGAPAIRQVTFHALGESVSRTIKHKAGVDFLVAPRRYVLDTILAAAAERAGADLRTGITVTGVRRDRRGQVAGVYGHDRGGAPIDIGARYVIGADGLRSRVAHSAGAAINEARPAGGAIQYAYYAGIPWTGMEFFVAERSFAGVFPTHHGQACIWVCTPSADARAARRRDRVPRGGLRRAAGAFCPAAGRAAAPGSPDLAGAGHAAPAQSGAPGVRPGLGAGGGRRLSPVTPSPRTASATRSATPSSWPSRLTRRSVPGPRRPRPSHVISGSATRRCGRSSRSPAAWPPIRRCRPSSRSRSS